MASATLLAHVLRVRFEYSRQRGSKSIGLGEFESDKTMRLFDKLWATRPFADTMLSRMPVQRDYRAKHGDRLAFPSQTPASDSMPVLQFIRAQDARLPPQYQRCNWHVRDTAWGKIVEVEPLCDLSKIASMVASGLITPAELQAVTPIASLIATLSERQVIALGRHDSPSETAAQIVWELSTWTKYAFDAIDSARNLAAGLDTPERSWEAIWQSWSYSRECYIKAGVEGADAFMSDRVAYAEGRDGVLSMGAAQGAAGALFLAAQPSPKEIWDDPHVQSLAFPAVCAWHWNTYFAGVLALVNSLDDASTRQRLHSLDLSAVTDAWRLCGCCLAVSRDDRPAVLSVKWLARHREDGSSQLPRPSDVLEGRIGVDRFIEVTAEALSQIVSDHVSEVTRACRIQES